MAGAGDAGRLLAGAGDGRGKQADRAGGMIDGAHAAPLRYERVLQRAAHVVYRRGGTRPPKISIHSAVVFADSAASSSSVSLARLASRALKSL